MKGLILIKLVKNHLLGISISIFFKKQTSPFHPFFHEKNETMNAKLQMKMRLNSCGLVVLQLGF